VSDQVSAPLATVLVRTKNEAASIGRLLEILASQTIADRLETIVVDSGSKDATVEIARDAGATVIEIAPEEFTYGRALNIGSAAANAPIVIALSAHAFPREDAWAERLVAKFDRPQVACASGAPWGPNRTPLSGELEQDLAVARRDHSLGYSNAAGAYRMELWRRRPFREDMPFTEDKEWAWHWLSEGWKVVLDPALQVEHDHSHDPLPTAFERARCEWAGFAMYLDVPPYPARALIRDWWSDLDGHANHARARLSPWRAARLLGKYAGLRR
jgi:glycosyltransferase involved in cell wall biosynthesis